MSGACYLFTAPCDSGADPSSLAVPIDKTNKSPTPDVNQVGRDGDLYRIRNNQRLDPYLSPHV